MHVCPHMLQDLSEEIKNWHLLPICAEQKYQAGFKIIIETWFMVFQEF